MDLLWGLANGRSLMGVAVWRLKGVIYAWRLRESSGEWSGVYIREGVVSGDGLIA